MSDSVMLTGKQIPIARLMALLKGMGLEEKGLKVGRGRSCMAIVKSEFGWKGNRRKIMTLLADHIEYLNRKYVASYLFPDDADDEYKEAGEIIEWAYPASNEWTDDQVFEEFCKVVDRGDRIKREHFIARDIDAEKHYNNR